MIALSLDRSAVQFIIADNIITALAVNTIILMLLLLIVFPTVSIADHNYFFLLLPTGTVRRAELRRLYRVSAAALDAEADGGIRGGACKEDTER